MKLRNKIAFLNTFVTLIILFISCFIILKAVDNFNLYTVYQSLLGQSDFSQQYLSEYFKLRENPVSVLEMEKAEIENRLEKQSGCSVEVVSVNVENPDSLQKSALDGKKSYYINTEGADRQMFISAPIIVRNQVIGAIIYKYSLYWVDNMRSSLQFMLFILFVIVAIVSLLLNYLVSSGVFRPLEKLTRATKEYSRGNFKKVVGIHTRDEIEKLTESFNDMGDNIMGMMDKQKKFLDDVTHEIRTPLTNILGYADLSNRVEGDEQKRKYNSYIIGEGNRLLDMVNNLLELSQLNRYELSVQKQETDLSELLEQISGLMADRAKKFGFSIINDLEKVNASIDSEKIKQVIINLIDNAIKYSEGDIIELKLRMEKRILIQVIDNGIGIPEDDIKNITEPFYRVDKSRSRKLGGNGLGLSICKNIVAVHGGNISIESKEGGGTIVTISLQP